MANQLLFIVAHGETLPEGYVRPESDRPRLSEVATDSNIPLIDLASPDKQRVIADIAQACSTYGFFQVINHGITEELLEKVMAVGLEFFRLPPEEKAKLYSDDPSKKTRLSTSFNVRKETVHNWRDYLRLHCHPLEEFVPEWPSNPESFNPDTESTHNSKGNASLRASVIDYYRGTQDPNGTGTRLAIACDNGGPHYVVNDHTLNKNDWFCAPLNGCSPGPKLWLSACTFGRAGFDDLKLLPKHIDDLVATCTTERVKIGLPLSLARVSEAANPGGATVGLDLDSGASMHAVGEARIVRGIRPLSFDRWATLADNSRLRIIGVGTIEMSGFSIPNVYLVEGLEKNLISVSQLDRDHAMCCCFHGGQCQIMQPDGTVVGGAILEENGLYKLRFLEVPQPEE